MQEPAQPAPRRTVSAVLITYKAEPRLRQCLASVAWCDEIVVLDNGNTEGTAAVCAEFGVRLSQAPDWPGFGRQRNRALALATGEWIFSIDADEVCPPALRRQIEARLSAPGAAAAFELPRRSNVCGHWIRRGGWGPARVKRVFRRGSAEFSDDVVNENLIVNGAVARLTEPLLHYSYDSLEQALAALDRDSTLGAQEAYARGRRANPLSAAARGGGAFVRAYFLRLGLLDGAAGLMLALYKAHSMFYRYLKLWLLDRAQTTGETAGETAAGAPAAAVRTPGAVRHETHPGESIAVVLPPVIGDSLFSMLIAHNLVRNGRRVVVFSNYMHTLRQWFPDMEIRPALDPAVAVQTLSGFNAAALKDWPHIGELARSLPRVIDLDRARYLSRKEGMADRFLDFCRLNLELPDVICDNGLRPAPNAGEHRGHRQRVVLHPGASTLNKRWPPEKFLRLALALRDRGFDPQFVIDPGEKPAWEHLQQHGLGQVNFDSLGDLAAWIYQSGWFIGNDSGIGHLTSNLGVPTLSLFMRKGSARNWRPSFGRGMIVVAGNWVPGGKLRERWWKQLMSVERVLAAFERLRAEGP